MRFFRSLSGPIRPLTNKSGLQHFGSAQITQAPWGGWTTDTALYWDLSDPTVAKRANNAASIWHHVGGTPLYGPTTEIFYFEVQVTGVNVAVGIRHNITSVGPSGTGGTNNAGSNGRVQAFQDGRKRENGIYTSDFCAPFVAGDYIGTAVEPDGTVKTYINGVLQGTLWGPGSWSSFLPIVSTYNSQNAVVAVASTQIMHLPPGHLPWPSA